MKTLFEMLDSSPKDFDRLIGRLYESQPVFRTPTSVKDAKSALRRLKKGIAKAEAERADAAKYHYDIGVKVQDERLAELRAAKTHFEAWISSQPKETKPSSRWKKQKVTVEGRKGPITFSAWVLGVWAVHGRPPASVTHIPTGKVMAYGGGPRGGTQDETKAAVEEMVDTDPIMLDMSAEDIYSHIPLLKKWSNKIRGYEDKPSPGVPVRMKKSHSRGGW